MIAELFEPLDIECLVRTAVELWETEDPSNLSERQQEILDRARNAVNEEQADRPPPYSAVTCLVPQESASDPSLASESAERAELITRQQAEAWAGRSLSDDELERLERAIPLSSIPDAISTIVGSLA